MDAARLETGIDTGAAAIFAAAAGFVAWKLAVPALPWVAAAAALAFLISRLALGRITAAPEFVVRTFHLAELGPFEPVVPDELLLGEDDRLESGANPDALVLDDILEKLGPDSRVVRLFDRSAMPTPGQLQRRIDRHDARQPLADASTALYAALDHLRQSLR